MTCRLINKSTFYLSLFILSVCCAIIRGIPLCKTPRDTETVTNSIESTSSATTETTDLNTAIQATSEVSSVAQADTGLNTPKSAKPVEVRSNTIEEEIATAVHTTQKTDQTESLKEITQNTSNNVKKRTQEADATKSNAKYSGKYTIGGKTWTKIGQEKHIQNHIQYKGEDNTIHQNMPLVGRMREQLALESHHLHPNSISDTVKARQKRREHEADVIDNYDQNNEIKPPMEADPPETSTKSRLSTAKFTQHPQNEEQPTEKREQDISRTTDAVTTEKSLSDRIPHGEHPMISEPPATKNFQTEQMQMHPEPLTSVTLSQLQNKTENPSHEDSESLSDFTLSLATGNTMADQSQDTMVKQKNDETNTMSENITTEIIGEDASTSNLYRESSPTVEVPSERKSQEVQTQQSSVPSGPVEAGDHLDQTNQIPEQVTNLKTAQFSELPNEYDMDKDKQRTPSTQKASEPKTDRISFTEEQISELRSPTFNRDVDRDRAGTNVPSITLREARKVPVGETGINQIQIETTDAFPPETSETPHAVFTDVLEERKIAVEPEDNTISEPTNISLVEQVTEQSTNSGTDAYTLTSVSDLHSVETSLAVSTELTTFDADQHGEKQETPESQEINKPLREEEVLDAEMLTNREDLVSDSVLSLGHPNVSAVDNPSVSVIPIIGLSTHGYLSTKPYVEESTNSTTSEPEEDAGQPEMDDTSSKPEQPVNELHEGNKTEQPSLSTISPDTSTVDEQEAEDILNPETVNGFNHGNSSEGGVVTFDEITEPVHPAKQNEGDPVNQNLTTPSSLYPESEASSLAEQAEVLNLEESMSISTETFTSTDGLSPEQVTHFIDLNVSSIPLVELTFPPPALDDATNDDILANNASTHQKELARSNLVIGGDQKESSIPVSSQSQNDTASGFAPSARSGIYPLTPKDEKDSASQSSLGFTTWISTCMIIWLYHLS